MIKMGENEVQTRGDELHEVWWQGRQWAVTSFGIEARDGCYPIKAGRLNEVRPGKRAVSDWLPHMAEKEWVDWDEFATAFMVACFLHNASVPAEMFWGGVNEADKRVNAVKRLRDVAKRLLR